MIRLSKSSLQHENVKISVEDMVKYYLEHRLDYEDGRDLPYGLHSDHYFVDYKNPLNKQCIDTLVRIHSDVAEQYNPKTLEDTINLFVGAGRGLVHSAYLVSGIGLLHILTGVVYPSVEPKFYGKYNPSSKIRSSLNNSYNNFSKWLEKDHSEGYAGLKKAGLGLAASPFIFLGALGTGLYDLAIDGYRAGRWSVKTGYKIGKFTLLKVAVPTALFLNPVSLAGKTYRCYNSLSSAVSEYLEERRKLKEETRVLKEKERIREEEHKQKRKKLKLDEEERKAKEREQRGSIILEIGRGFVEIGRGFSLMLQDIYHNILEGPGVCDSLDEWKLTRIVEYSESCQNYASFFNITKGLDGLVSSALNEKPFEIKYCCGEGRNSSSQMVVGRVQNSLRNPKLIFDLRDIKLNDWIKNLDGSNSTDFNYQLFESILHAKTHMVLKIDEHHNKSFYDKKEELRMQIADYLLAHGISIKSYVDSLLIKGHGQIVRFIPAEEFMKMGGLKIRGLIKKKYKLQKEYAEIKRLLSK